MRLLPMAAVGCAVALVLAIGCDGSTGTGGGLGRDGGATGGAGGAMRGTGGASGGGKGPSDAGEACLDDHGAVRSDLRTCTSDSDAGAGPECDAGRCLATQVCVNPPTSIGGAQPPCQPLGDSGGCPKGAEYQPACGGLPGGGCVAIYVPPPPYCADVPASCGDALTCQCLGPGVCGGSGNECQDVSGGQVTCVNLAP